MRLKIKAQPSYFEWLCIATERARGEATDSAWAWRRRAAAQQAGTAAPASAGSSAGCDVTYSNHFKQRIVTRTVTVYYITIWMRTMYNTTPCVVPYIQLDDDTSIYNTVLVQSWPHLWFKRVWQIVQYYNHDCNHDCNNWLGPLIHSILLTWAVTRSESEALAACQLF